MWNVRTPLPKLQLQLLVDDRSNNLSPLSAAGHNAQTVCVERVRESCPKSETKNFRRECEGGSGKWWWMESTQRGGCPQVVCALEAGLLATSSLLFSPALRRCRDTKFDVAIFVECDLLSIFRS